MGEISVRLTGDALLELRDPLGRWITYVPSSDEYRSGIPNAEATRHYPVDFEASDDDPLSAADTTGYTGVEFSEDRIRVPGPLDGEYVLRVIHKPAAEWWLYVDGFGAGVVHSSYVAAPSGFMDTVSTYRLRFELVGGLVEIDSLQAAEPAPTRPARVPLRLPCEPDPFDSLLAAHARIELRGPGSPALSVTLPDGRVYSARQDWISGGRGVASTYTPHPAVSLLGTPRGWYQVAVEASVTGIHVVSISRDLPGGVRLTRRDSLVVRAGDARHWHASWSEPSKRDSRWVRLERGPVPVPPGVVTAATILAVGSEPALTTDGRSLAFVRGSGLWRMDLATGARKCLGTFRSPHWPSWSPDGRRILFQMERAGARPGEFAIWTVEADGTGLRQVVPPGPRPDQYPIWSPRGDRIVWTRGNQLWIADASGARARPLTQDPAPVFERACEWPEKDDEILYAASAGACDGPQYTLRRVRPDGVAVHAHKPEIRAQDARAIPGKTALCATDGWRVFVTKEEPTSEATLLLLGHETAGFHRSRITLSPDGKTAFTDGDPFPYGEPVILRLELSSPESPHLLKRWRDAFMLVGADSSIVEATWGRPHGRGQNSSGVRVWSYSLRERGEHEDGWLQFYFRRSKLWSVTRGPQPVGGFPPYP